jgi:hypothetical protein
VEAAARISTQSVLASVNQLLDGIDKVKEEVKSASSHTKLTEDSFVQTMQSFIIRATPAVEMLRRVVTKLESDIQFLLKYVGEDPTTTKLEDVCGVISSFAASLQRVRGEIEEIDMKNGEKTVKGRAKVRATSRLSLDPSDLNELASLRSLPKIAPWAKAISRMLSETFAQVLVCDGRETIIGHYLESFFRIKRVSRLGSNVARAGNFFPLGYSLMERAICNLALVLDQLYWYEITSKCM